MSVSDNVRVYDAWAEYYDLVNGDRSPYIAFYESLVTDDVGSVLELGCGTGAVLAAIAQDVTRARPTDVVRFVGVDGSEGMLERARERDGRLTWRLGDMKDTSPDAPFDLIFSCFNTLQHCRSEAELLAVLRAVEKALSARGLFAFDIYQPNLEYLCVARSDRLIRPLRGLNGEALEICEDASYDEAARLYATTWRLQSAGGGAELSRVRCEYYQFSASDIERLLARAGLAISQRFGDLDRSPFTPQAKKQVVVCRRRLATTE